MSLLASWGRRFFGSRIRVAVVASLLTGVVTVGATAYASIPDSNGVIHGCYVRSTGRLRVIDPSTGATCRADEIAIAWSQAGPAGPPGPAGPTGPAGPPGTPGTPSPSFSVSPTTFNLGAVEVGSGTPYFVATVTNVTSKTAFVDQQGFSSLASTCTAEPIPPGGTCAIVYQLLVQQDGPVTGTDWGSLNDQTVEIQYTYTGVGSAENPAVTVGPPDSACNTTATCNVSLDFGSVAVGTTSAPVDIVVTNSGPVDFDLGLLGVSLQVPKDVSDPFAYDSADSTCNGGPTDHFGPYIAPGSSCTIAFTFDPATSGPLSSGADVTFDAAQPTDCDCGPSYDVAVNLTGVGV